MEENHPAKRVKLEESKGNNSRTSPVVEEEVEDNCSICLNHKEDRTVIPKCSHEFCFECLLVWTAQSRRCPLCTQEFGNYIIHSIRSRYDYRKHYLPPLKASPPPAQREFRSLQDARRRALTRRREREWHRQRREEMDEVDRLERSISKRRWIYQHDLYAKHVASNSYTKFRPFPTPAQFSAASDLISRTTTFIRRELQVWEGLDVEFLTNLIISLMKSIDIRSESAVKLLSEFLDLDEPYVPGGRHINAEHFAHEVYCYVRSPYKDLFIYDTVVQYDTPAGLQPPPEISRRRRWNQPSGSRSRSPPNPSRSPSPGRAQQRRSTSRRRGDPRSHSPIDLTYSSDENIDANQHPVASTSQEVQGSFRKGPQFQFTEGHEVNNSRRSPSHSIHNAERYDATPKEGLLATSVPSPPTSDASTRPVSPSPDSETATDLKGKRKAEYSSGRHVPEVQELLEINGSARRTGNCLPHQQAKSSVNISTSSTRPSLSKRDLHNSIRSYLTGTASNPRLLGGNSSMRQESSHIGESTSSDGLLARMSDSSHNLPDQAPLRSGMSMEPSHDRSTAGFLATEVAASEHLRMGHTNFDREVTAMSPSAKSKERGIQTPPPNEDQNPKTSELERSSQHIRPGIHSRRNRAAGEDQSTRDNNEHDTFPICSNIIEPIPSCALSGVRHNSELSNRSLSASVPSPPSTEKRSYSPSRQVATGARLHVRSPEQGSIEASQDTPIRETSQSNSASDSISHHADAACSSRPPGVRMTLMERLEKERGSTEPSNEQDPSSSSARHGNCLTNFVDGADRPRPRDFGSDVLLQENREREASLKKRAQLKMRLAAEKKKGGVA